MSTVKILGGMAAPRSITFVSSDRISQAVFNDNGKISTTVTPLPKFIQLILNNQNWYIPRTLRMMALMPNLLNPKKMIGFLALIVGMVLGQIHKSLQPAGLNESTLHWSIKLAIFALVMGGALFIVNKKIATWHAAEHMACWAYEKYESCDINLIAGEDRFHPKCGTRIVVPLMIAIGLANLIAGSHILVSVALILVAHEFVFRIDKGIGFDNIPVFSQISEWTQRNIVTRDPGTDELRTAQQALIGLLDPK